MVVLLPATEHIAKEIGQLLLSSSALQVVAVGVIGEGLEALLYERSFLLIFATGGFCLLFARVFRGSLS